MVLPLVQSSNMLVQFDLLFKLLIPSQFTVYSSDKLEVVYLSDFTLNSKRLEKIETIISVSNFELYCLQLWTFLTF